MSTRFILRESHQGRITPRPDLGLYASRKAAKAEAARQGLVAFTVISIRRRAA